MSAELTKSEIRRASAHIFELLLDWFPDIIQSVDEEGRIVYANRQAAVRPDSPAATITTSI